MELEALLKKEAERSKERIPDFPDFLEQQLFSISRKALKEMMIGIMGLTSPTSVDSYLYRLRDITRKEKFQNGRQSFDKEEIRIAWIYCHQRRAWGNRFENERIDREFTAQWWESGRIDYIENVGCIADMYESTTAA